MSEDNEGNLSFKGSAEFVEDELVNLRLTIGDCEPCPATHDSDQRIVNRIG